MKLKQICDYKQKNIDQSNILNPIAKNLVKSVWENFCLLKSSPSDLSKISKKYGSEILCQTVLHLSGVSLEQFQDQVHKFLCLLFDIESIFALLQFYCDYCIFIAEMGKTIQCQHF